MEIQNNKSSIWTNIPTNIYLEINQMVIKAYGIEFINSINKLTNLQIILLLLILNNIFVLLTYLG